MPNILDERVIEKLSERVVSRIEEANLFILKEIAECIAEVGKLTPSRSQQLAQILKYGGNYSKITNKLAQMTNLSLKDIEEIYKEVAKRNYSFAKKFYDYRKKEYIPFEKNVALQKQIKSLTRIAQKEFLNLSNTTALGFEVLDNEGNVIFKGLKKTYLDAIDNAVVNVGQGKSDVETQIRKMVKQIGGSGLKRIEYESGYKRRLDSAVRMNIQGALRDYTIDLQEQFGKEFESDGVEISVHENPAPDHAEIQGHQFNKKEFEKMQTEKKFEDLNGKKYEAMKRHIGRWNCMHYTFPIIIGVSEPSFSKEKLKDILNNNKKGFEFEGKKYTNYEGTQLQRQIETKIRQKRDILAMAKVTNDTELQNSLNKEIRALANKYHRLSKESGLKTKMERLKI